MRFEFMFLKSEIEKCLWCGWLFAEPYTECQTLAAHTKLRET